MQDSPMSVLNRNSGKPLYFQIYQALNDLLQSGKLKAGDQFPRELELAKEYRVARITVRRAIAEMVSEGRLVRLAGKGTFVATPKIMRYLVDVSSFTARLEALGLQASGQVVETKTTPATPQLARELEVSEGSPIISITRIRFANNDPVALEMSYLSLERCPGLEQIDLNNVSLYRLLSDRYGLIPARSRKTLELTTANVWEARHLNIATGHPLFLIRATVLDQLQPIEYLKALLRGERFRFQIDSPIQQER